MADRLVFFFGNGQADGGREDKDLLGGKGANLAEMTRVGVPVPPGFTITTDVCRAYLRDGRYPDGLQAQVDQALARLEEETGKRFGGGTHPLLLSVRSGAAVSMPGMMDTILNLGLNDETVEAMAEATENPRFAWDSYRRLVQMYGDVVLGVPEERFEAAIERVKHERDAATDADLDADALAALTSEFRDILQDESGEPFPTDPREQLRGAIEAVFRSWRNDRAIEYRRHHEIPEDLGTAVTVMAMVYGNMGTDSGTGVAFTRNPATGEQGIFGEFLLNAQGEDVVAGIRDPVSIEELADRLPDAYDELLDVLARLERHYGEMQDLEFTVERGKLYLLQTRTGKRTAEAAVRIAVDMVEEGMIDREDAIGRIDADHLERLLHPRIDPDAEADADVLTTGLPASPGAVAGAIVFDPDRAVARAEAGESVVLVRRETSPDDFHGMAAAGAILTARGGMTSHAAVVARGMGKCCVVGARELSIDADGHRMHVGGRTFEEGDPITVDGSTGRILDGRIPTVEARPPAEFERLMAWADERRGLRVRANADSGADASQARALGAEGIGLCRTEHMFFEETRLRALRQLMLAEDADARRRALSRLVGMQRDDFLEIFRAMDGLPVTIRLLDPPLHEFLPHTDAEMREVADAAELSVEDVRRRVERTREQNPMLGHRGARLGLSYPEITEMQARAIFEAAAEATEDGVAVRPEIMVPLVATAGELEDQKRVISEAARAVFEHTGRPIPYLVGTMIEVPRAALTAGEIAAEAEFFSFGTNDLTQMTFAMSRDDAAGFLPEYVERGIIPRDPFQTLDVEGVGRLVELAGREGRSRRPDLKVGICGEHGGDPASIGFFHEVGLDYVSCSPFRVPVARLAAAQAAIRDERSAEPGREADARPADAGERVGDGRAGRDSRGPRRRERSPGARPGPVRRRPPTAPPRAATEPAVEAGGD